MAQGKKYNDDIREKAFALLACNNSVAEVARTLKLPYSTVKTWKYNYLARSEELARQATEDERSEELDLAKLRRVEKERLIRNAWRIIGKSQKLIERRIDKALDNPNIPECEIGVRELSTVMGTLYDKASLAAREPTEIIEGEVAVKRFEEL